MHHENSVALTERQAREVEYHREHAKLHAAALSQSFSWEVLDNPVSRWWNGYWSMYAALQRLDLQGKRVLVVGCGFGDDALRLARMGAEVHAFDLSPDSLAIARELAVRNGVGVTFDEMPAESLAYPDEHFDVILARDILHHVDIPASMRELRRVAKPDAAFVVNEIFSHSWTEAVRRSWLVEKVLYGRMQRWIYGPGKPYITEDERKLTERDLALVLAGVEVNAERHFNFLVNRVLPEREALAKLDRLTLALLRPIGRWLAGRVLIVGRFC
jgi:2-polyprenyl-3-methyl-5-hydroxy-6-metoxy-1,4-benzoquinol methylase